MRNFMDDVKFGSLLESFIGYNNFYTCMYVSVLAFINTHTYVRM